VKPVVAKAEVTEEPPKIVELKEKKIGAETIKGDPDAVLTVAPVGPGPPKIVEEDNQFTTLQVSK
jgi:protein TonB